MHLNEFTQKYDEDGATKEFKIKTRARKLIVGVAKMRGVPVWKAATSLLYELFVGVRGQFYAQDFS
jgi:hypothetical protein